jgi:hypothetical protein
LSGKLDECKPLAPGAIPLAVIPQRNNGAAAGYGTGGGNYTHGDMAGAAGNLKKVPGSLFQVGGCYRPVSVYNAARAER